MDMERPEEQEHEEQQQQRVEERRPLSHRSYAARFPSLCIERPRGRQKSIENRWTSGHASKICFQQRPGNGRM